MITVMKHAEEVLIAGGVRRVFFVSSNPADRHLLQLAIEEMGLRLDVQFFENGEALHEYLEKPRTVIDKGDVFFVDYFLPRQSGLNLLGDLREKYALAHQAVFMMVPALFETILQQSYVAGANCCVLMPVDFFELISTLKGVLGYWDKMLRVQ
ncbi:MAG: response regulator [Bacteroidota bacterium]